MRKLVLIVVPAILSISACTDTAPRSDMRDSAETTDNGTIASSVSEDPALRSLKVAMTDTQLSTALDRKGDYTLLAPNDAAFSALGDKAKDLAKPDNLPFMVAILRGHILPGQVTAESITKAIDRKKGPVQMMTMSGTPVTFSKTDDGLLVGNGAIQATLLGATKVSNGAVVKIDKVLVPAG